MYCPLSWSNRFWSERGKRSSLIANVKGPRERNAILIFSIPFFLPKVIIVTRKEGKKIKHEENSHQFHFWAYVLKKHIHLLVHSYFSWSTFGLHPVRGPKALKMHFLEVKSWKCGHGKGPLTWDNFMVYDVNIP